MKKKKKKTAVDQAIESMVNDTEKNEYERIKKKPSLKIEIEMGTAKKK